MAQKNKKTAKKKKKNPILVILLIIFALIIIGESYLLFAKANTMWPYNEQGMNSNQELKNEIEKENVNKVENTDKKETPNNSYDNSNYKPEETITTDENINENGIDTSKQSTETQQDMNVLYGPEE